MLLKEHANDNKMIHYLTETEQSLESIEISPKFMALNELIIQLHN